MNDVKPLQAFFVVPEVAATYPLSDNLYVATILQALERIKEQA